MSDPALTLSGIAKTYNKGKPGEVAVQVDPKAGPAGDLQRAGGGQDRDRRQQDHRQSE